jgi:hypothetical protein
MLARPFWPGFTLNPYCYSLAILTPVLGLFYPLVNLCSLLLVSPVIGSSVLGGSG